MDHDNYTCKNLKVSGDCLLDNETAYCKDCQAFYAKCECCMYDGITNVCSVCLWKNKRPELKKDKIKEIGKAIESNIRDLSAKEMKDVVNLLVEKANSILKRIEG